MTLPNLFVLGDSISIEYGPFLEQLTTGKWQYARKTGMSDTLLTNDIPQGGNGGDSRMCLDYLATSNTRQSIAADVLLLNCGLHDIKLDAKRYEDGTKVPLEEYKVNLAKIIKVVKQMGPKLVWVRTTPVNEAQHNTPDSKLHRLQRDVERYNEAADGVMRAHGVPAIDLFGFTMSLGPTDKTLRDGRHFHQPVSQLQAAYIAGWLEGMRCR